MLPGKNLTTMATKKNLSEVKSYIPPRLVKAQQGWYVVYYHEVAGTWCRERKTFNLNRISDKRRRMDRAHEIIEQLDAGLANKGSGDVEFNALSQTNIVEAIRFSVDIICQSPKRETRKSFRMIEKMLISFIEKKKWQDISVGAFDAKCARAFMDDAVRRGISNTTFNNYRCFATIVFNRLIRRDYIKANPFHRIEKMEREEKQRRPFTAEERAAVLAEIYLRDYWLFVLVLLHFLCLIRRTECFRLRFSNFNLKEGFIFLPKTATKNKKQAVVTIPDTLRDFLRDERFARHPGNFLVFGKGGEPHASISAGDNTFKERHRRLLLRLRKEKKIEDITGLSLYSWKDTGMTEFAKILRPVELRDHARHASIDMSLAYYHAEKVNPNVKEAKIQVKTK